MRLFVDDIRNAPDETWKVARTITDAISAIDIFDFEVISLDHDISHQVVVGAISRPYPCNEVFTPVAMFIKEKYANTIMPQRKPKIIIHTSNPAGAMRMAGVLKDFEVERRESVPANRLENEV